MDEWVCGSHTSCIAHGNDWQTGRACLDQILPCDICCLSLRISTRRNTWGIGGGAGWVLRYKAACLARVLHYNSRIQIKSFTNNTSAWTPSQTTHTKTLVRDQ